MKRRAHPTVNTNIANVLSKIRGGEGGEEGEQSSRGEAGRGQKNRTNIRGSFQKNTTQRSKTKTGTALTSQENRPILAMTTHTEVGSRSCKDLKNTGSQTQRTQQILRKGGSCPGCFRLTRPGRMSPCPGQSPQRLHRPPVHPLTPFCWPSPTQS